MYCTRTLLMLSFFVVLTCNFAISVLYFSVYASGTQCTHIVQHCTQSGMYSTLNLFYTDYENTAGRGIARNLIWVGINLRHALVTGTISNLSWVKETKQPHKIF